MIKKYKMLKKDTVTYRDTTLYRIKALRAGKRFSKGDLGGYIRAEHNLSQEGDCWVADNAYVSDSSTVIGDALVRHKARITGNVLIKDYARIEGNAKIEGNASVMSYAYVGDDAIVREYAGVSGNAKIEGNAIVEGRLLVKNEAKIDTNGHLNDIKRYITVSPIGSESGILTAYLTTHNKVMVNRGCFTGTLEKFIKQVFITHGDTVNAKRYFALIPFIEEFFKEFTKEEE